MKVTNHGMKDRKLHQEGCPQKEVAEQPGYVEASAHVRIAEHHSGKARVNKHKADWRGWKFMWPFAVVFVAPPLAVSSTLVIDASLSALAVRNVYIIRCLPFPHITNSFINSGMHKYSIAFRVISRQAAQPAYI